MKRTIILCSEFPPGPGGIGNHALNVAKVLNDNGWPILVVSPQDFASETEIKAFNTLQPFHIERLPISAFKLCQSLKRFLSIRKVIWKFKPDVLIASGAHAVWVAAFFLQWYKIPWILVGHGTEFGAQKGVVSWLTRVSGNQANCAICVSNFTLNALKALGITRPPSVVIHNAADHNLFYQLPIKQVISFRENQNVDDKFVLLTVGNVSDRKGQEVVIRALPRIKEDCPKVQYWMAGLPQKQFELEAIAKKLGVEENIRFWGRVDYETLLMLYNACDLFVMTSRKQPTGDFEGFGIAVIEAALCGKAAVVSDNSGLAEAVKHGKTGLLVSQDDFSETAEAVLSLVRNPELLERLKQSAQRNAIEHHNWDIVGQRYILQLEKLFKANG